MKKIALVACSNGLPTTEKENINKLVEILSDMDLELELSPYLYAHKGGAATSESGDIVTTGKLRAEILNKYFEDKEIEAIFDISGGDMANEVLLFLDYDIIKNSRAVFYGYSDLTTIINAIQTKTGKKSVLYQIKNLIWDETGVQRRRFQSFLEAIDKQEKTQPELFLPKWAVLQGAEDIEELLQETKVVGGNIRCFLKLAGTPYFPEVKGNVLLLESLGGTVPQISTYMAQLAQLGVFQEAKGILLGTFTKMENEDCKPTAYEIMKEYLPKDMFVAQTKEIGHGVDSKAIFIG